MEINIAIQIEALRVSISASTLTHQLCDCRKATGPPETPQCAQGPG